MPSLQIRDLTPEAYASLVRRAEHNRRSLSQEAAHMLESQLGADFTHMQRRRRLIAKLRSRHADGSDARTWPTGMPSPEALIREDRDR